MSAVLEGHRSASSPNASCPPVIGLLSACLMLILLTVGTAGCSRGEEPSIDEGSRGGGAAAPGAEEGERVGDDADGEAPVEEGDVQEGDAEESDAEASASVDPSIFVENPVIDGLPMGFTEDGYPYRGSPDAAVLVEEFSDYHCPFCGRFASDTLPELLETYAAEGKVRFVFREFPIIQLHPEAEMPSRAAVCVAEQGIEPFWKMHDALFVDQGSWSGLADPDAYLAEMAVLSGADEADFQECYASGRADAIVQAGVAEARGLGFNGTPSFQVSRVDSDEAFPLIGAQPLSTFEDWLDAMLAGEDPPIPPTPAPPELPAWANDEGLAPDAARPGVNAAGDPFLGDPTLDVTIVEFTDYQCEPCQDFERDVFPVVQERLIDSGRVRWVVKHLPLPEHPQSVAAAAAAECALEQERFWDMHAALHETVDRWAVSEPDAALIAVASELGLDEGAFAACLSGRAAVERVLADVFDAQDVTQSTPAFVVLKDGTGQVLRGNRSADAFLDTIEGAISGEGSDDS